MSQNTGGVDSSYKTVSLKYKPASTSRTPNIANVVPENAFLAVSLPNANIERNKKADNTRSFSIRNGVTNSNSKRQKPRRAPHYDSITTDYMDADISKDNVTNPTRDSIYRQTMEGSLMQGPSAEHQMSSRQTQMYNSTVRKVFKNHVGHTPYQKQSIAERLEVMRTMSTKRDKRAEYKALNAERVQ